MKNLFLLLLFITSESLAQNTPEGTDSIQISLITYGPTQSEVYSAFGHSAIRVYIPAQGIDYAYNYGIFDFHQPHFYLNFTRGFLYYQLGVNYYPELNDYYKENNRFIHEQILNLSLKQKDTIIKFLDWNSREENKIYRYDYFFNNCSTKIRDVFENLLKKDIRFDGSFIKSDYTIRQLTDIYLKQQPWGDLGIDFCLGLPMDKHATAYDYMFLPDYLESSFDHATIRIDGKEEPFVKSKQLIFASVPASEKMSLFNPWTVFGGFLLIVIIISFNDWRKKKLSKWLDVPLFLTTGLLGLLLVILWTMTDHKAAANNFNILWTLPTHIFSSLFLLKKTIPRWIARYFINYAIMCTLMLLCWTFIPQSLNPFLIPLITALALRGFIIYRLGGS